MSTLLTALKTEVMKARKSGDKARSNVGLVLIGEIETDTKRSGKDLTDEQLVAKVKKLIESNKEMIGYTQDRTKLDVLEQENAFLETFLPKQLSDDELTDIIKASGLDNIGAIMGHLKQNYAGQFDGKKASALARAQLQ